MERKPPLIMTVLDGNADNAGQKLVVIGLTDALLKHLTTKGQIHDEKMGDYSGIAVLLVHGRNENTVLAKIKKLFPPGTQIDETVL